jgi:formylmethanofuran dehydrogenase subunit E
MSESFICDRCDDEKDARNIYKLDDDLLCWGCFNKTLLEQEYENE